MISFLIGAAVAGAVLRAWKGPEVLDTPEYTVTHIPSVPSCMPSRGTEQEYFVFSNMAYQNRTPIEPQPVNHITYNITINGKVEEHDSIILDRCINGSLQRFEREQDHSRGQEVVRIPARQGEKSGDYSGD